MCTALPLGADVAHLANSCDKSVPHLVIINYTTGQILNCYTCTFCQQGTGLSIPCNGQNVTTDKLDIHCKPCIPGVNYSTGESIQCQDCLTKVMALKESFFSYFKDINRVQKSHMRRHAIYHTKDSAVKLHIHRGLET